MLKCVWKYGNVYKTLYILEYFSVAAGHPVSGSNRRGLIIKVSTTKYNNMFCSCNESIFHRTIRPSQMIWNPFWGNFLYSLHSLVSKKNQWKLPIIIMSTTIYHFMFCPCHGFIPCRSARLFSDDVKHISRQFLKFSQFFCFKDEPMETLLLAKLLIATYVIVLNLAVAKVTNSDVCHCFHERFLWRKKIQRTMIRTAPCQSLQLIWFDERERTKLNLNVWNDT